MENDGNGDGSHGSENVLPLHIIEEEVGSCRAISWRSNRMLIHAFGSWVRSAFLIERPEEARALSLDDEEGRVRASWAFNFFRNRLLRSRASTKKQKKLLLYSEYVMSYSLMYICLLRMQRYAERSKTNPGIPAIGNSESFRVIALQRAMVKLVNRTRRKRPQYPFDTLLAAFSELRSRVGNAKSLRKRCVSALSQCYKLGLRVCFGTRPYILI